MRPGDTAWPGMVVAQLPELSTLGVTARLFDVDDERVRQGETVRARLDAFPDREYTGWVRSVDEMANQDGRFSLRRFFNVEITLDEVDPELMRPGMSVKVEIDAPPLADVLMVPRTSLDWSRDEPQVGLAGGRIVPVQLGPCNAFQCVVESGLEEGERLGRVEEAAL
jgi:HlyD family secretion protein